MTLEKWLVHPGETRVIDIDDVRRLKVGLVGGQIDVVTHDEPGIRIQVHGVSVKDLRIEATGDRVEIDHAQLRWDNFLEVFRNFGSGGPSAEISVAVPAGVELTLGVVSASALVSGLGRGASLNTVSGDIIVDGLTGDLSVKAVSGDVQVRGLDGALSANTVSGDLAATGTLRSADIDTVSGAVLLDVHGPVHTIGINTVGGATTLRLPERLAANYVVRSVSGRVVIDGEVHSGRGTGPTTNYAGSHGELAGSFVDVRANSVSGDITVLRHAGGADEAAEPTEAAAGDSGDAPTPEEW